LPLKNKIPPSINILPLQNTYIKNKKNYDGFKIIGKLLLAFYFFLISSQGEKGINSLYFLCTVNISLTTPQGLPDAHAIVRPTLPSSKSTAPQLSHNKILGGGPEVHLLLLLLTLDHITSLTSSSSPSPTLPRLGVPAFCPLHPLQPLQTMQPLPLLHPLSQKIQKSLEQQPNQSERIPEGPSIQTLLLEYSGPWTGTILR
jgi:hypothetical protein